jgi:uncharacterized membrane protein
MLTFHNYISLISGLIFILYSIVIILFPPGFGNSFYGVHTKWTMKNKVTWNYGQKLFAVSLIIIGLIFSIAGASKIDSDIPPYAMFVLLVILWSLSKFIVHKLLAKKYSAL